MTMLAAVSVIVLAMRPPSPESCTRAAVLRTAMAATAAATASLSTSTFHDVRAMPPPAVLAGAPEAPAMLQEQAAPRVLYTPPSIKGASTPEQRALAEHLARKGAKFYGAYWCSFCNRQRALFGAGGSRALPYVECDANGYENRNCPPQVKAYPTWEIDGKWYSGLRTLQDLQAISGFDPAVQFPEYVPPPPPPRPPPPPGGFKPPVVQAASTAEQLALARHLQASGARFYGAYWCRYCSLQRTLFGAEGSAALPYVECAADGYQSATAACRAKPQVDGYPTWEISGKFYGGYQSLDELARLSGFDAARGAGASSAAVVAAKGSESSDDLGIDFSSAARVRSGDDCELGSPEDCK